MDFKKEIILEGCRRNMTGRKRTRRNLREMKRGAQTPISSSHHKTNRVQ
ncbi:hypothetical protein SNOG_08207 [Parastagonospora nodorum SN15]|uniref:Uncharacterized protein n=1 Tax=Phaeosphaeria nodorum (strain SN15 / ATCC MYA-4574 / FGSC 10173) TaxID=321614 RepID=Q0UJ57_PHANO|nr:hypothetical protein SNOG_08207 [Parastagonospora nodorum SN15]EAT84483.1 hypothetical protein SNOG_08207 [Parastagonospora nodorum SN15]